jgi:hypothetical protein
MDATTITQSDGTVTVARPVLPQTVTPKLLRQFMQGGISQDVLAMLPRFLVAELEQIARRLQRQQARYVKRETKAIEYRSAALAGGGKREVARRARQIAAAV